MKKKPKKTKPKGILVRLKLPRGLQRRMTMLAHLERITPEEFILMAVSEAIGAHKSASDD